MDKIMQKHEAYKVLPAKVAQMVLKQVDEAWISYFAACEAYMILSTKTSRSSAGSVLNVDCTEHQMGERSMRTYRDY
jgi:hypothetical protein